MGKDRTEFLANIRRRENLALFWTSQAVTGVRPVGVCVEKLVSEAHTILQANTRLAENRQ